MRRRPWARDLITGRLPQREWRVFRAISVPGEPHQRALPGRRPNTITLYDAPAGRPWRKLEEVSV